MTLSVESVRSAAEALPDGPVAELLLNIAYAAEKDGRDEIDMLDRAALSMSAVWYPGDIEGMLRYRRVEPSAENIRKFAADTKSTVEAAAVAAGNEAMENHLDFMIRAQEF